MKHSNRLLVVALAAAVLVTGGCATTREPNYYLMAPTPSETAPAAPSRLVVGVGPITIPDYLERLNIVTRASESRILIPPDHKWAAPLDAHLTELLAENLRTRLALAAAPIFPWQPGTRVDYQVMLEVASFIHYGDKVVLDARWRLFDRPSHVVKEGNSRVEALSDDEYEHVVGAMSQAVGHLADDIAEGVRAVTTTSR